MLGKLPTLSVCQVAHWNSEDSEGSHLRLLEELYECLRAGLLVWVWPRVGAQPGLTPVVMMMLCQSLQTHDLIAFRPHHPVDVITSFAG